MRGEDEREKHQILFMSIVTEVERIFEELQLRRENETDEQEESKGKRAIPTEWVFYFAWFNFLL